MHAGAAFAVGMLPAALAGVPPRRSDRVRGALLSALTGLCVLVGGVLSAVPVLAVAAIFLLGVGTARLAARSRLGVLAMTLTLPMVGIGLSFDAAAAATAAALIALGGLWARLVSLAWPSESTAPRPARPAGGTGRRSSTASGSAPRVPRPRRSGSCSTSTMSAGPSRRRSS